jgi:hypothetical protein
VCSWTFDREGSAVSDDSPTLLPQPSVPVYKARGWIPWSIEIGQDYPGFADEIAQLLAAGYHELLAQKLTVGAVIPTGVSSPLGTRPIFRSSRVASDRSRPTPPRPELPTWPGRLKHPCRCVR